MTNVKRLKAIIDGLPDDAVVLMPGSDHSLRPAEVRCESAMVYCDSRKGTPHYCEDFGDSCNDEGGKRIAALIIS